MHSGFPDNQQYLQSLDENSNSGLDKSDTLLNDRYRILKIIGQGGFGQTFLAIDEKYLQNSQSLEYSTSNLCVLKQFFPQSQTGYHSHKALELFQQESLRLAELSKSSQIPQILDTFEQKGRQYLVQEWVDGQNLEQELAEVGAFNEADIWQLLGELLPLLQFIHAHQVIHRDIKPANIIRRRQDRQLFLVDFGSAQYNWQGRETGTIIGSAEYAAPEQVRGKAIFASDLYSLGVTCLHLLTQMSPFDLYDCSENVWIWRSYLVDPISPSLEKILCKLVQPATRLRYYFAADALIDLNNLPKNLGSSSTFSANTDIDEGFETPFFGLEREADLFASVTSFPDSSVASVTIFDPKTQTWHYLPATTEGGELARKVAAFLRPRLAAATVTPPVQEKKSTAVDKQAGRKLNKIYQIVTAIAFTIACLGLDRVNELIATATSDLVTKQDLATIQRLQEEFKAELATLRGRVDSLEARTAQLEAHQFSTTTKLVGEAIFAFTDNFGSKDNNTVFQDRVRLDLQTSFTGKDTLHTRIATGNATGLSLPNGTAESTQTFNLFNGSNNTAFIDWLAYYFPIGNSQVYIAASGGIQSDYVPTLNPYFQDFDGGNGALSTFASSSPIYRIGGGAGLGVNVPFGSGKFKPSLTLGYLASQANTPSADSGLFAGNYAALAQLNLDLGDRLSFAVTYVHGYHGAGSALFDAGAVTSAVVGTA